MQELTPDFPESGEGGVVSLLLEVTDDRGITYAGMLAADVAGGFAGDFDFGGSMTPVVK